MKGRNLHISLMITVMAVVAGCGGSGDDISVPQPSVGLIPNISSMNPSSGGSGTVVTLQVSNYSEGYELMFNGSPVEVEGDDGTNASAGITFAVPELDEGMAPVYLTDGVNKSHSKYFTITGPEDDGDPNGSGNNPVPQGDGDDDPPGKDYTAKATADVCYCPYDYDDGKDMPDEMKCAAGTAVCLSNEMRGALVVNWSVSKVKSAFLSLHGKNLRKSYKPFSYMSFIGDLQMPHLGAKAAGLDGWKGTLLEDPMSEFASLASSFQSGIIGDQSTLPFNYCRMKTGGGSSEQNDAARCFVTNLSMSDGESDLVNIFLPLVEGETERSGSWSFEVGDDVVETGMAMMLYYKTWTDKVLGYSIKVEAFK